jgi:hypothetical protein
LDVGRDEDAVDDKVEENDDDDGMVMGRVFGEPKLLLN